MLNYNCNDLLYMVIGKTSIFGKKKRLKSQVKLKRIDHKKFLNKILNKKNSGSTLGGIEILIMKFISWKYNSKLY